MKNTIRILTAVIFVIISSQNAFADKAESTKNWYTRLGLGYAKQIDSYDETNFGTTAWDFDGGANLTASLGYSAKHWSLEGEFSYKQMEMDSRTRKITGIKSNYDGDQSQTAIMINAFLIPKPDWTFSPFIGAGIGFTKITWNDVKYPSNTSRLDDSDMVFTYQLIVGISHQISPRLALEVDYRYFVPDAPEIIEIPSGVVGSLDNQELNIFGIALKYKF